METILSSKNKRLLPATTHPTASKHYSHIFCRLQQSLLNNTSRSHMTYHLTSVALQVTEYSELSRCFDSVEVLLASKEMPNIKPYIQSLIWTTQILI